MADKLKYFMARFSSLKNLSLRQTKWTTLFALVMFIGFVALWGRSISLTIHPGSDWQGNYYPAIRDLLQGKSPYTGHAAYNPFWAYLLLIPFALLPPDIGNIAVGLACMATFAFVAYKLGAKPLSFALLMFTPQLFFLSRNGGIDWLVTLGYILPPQVGLFFVLIKPQIGITVALFWFVEAWRRGKLRKVLQVFMPIGLAYAVGYFLFGTDAIWRGSAFIGSSKPWDLTTFPFTVPEGLALLLYALRTRNIKWSIPASPLLAPYVAFYSWPAALLGIVDNEWLMVPAVMSMWILAVLKTQY